jgi:hypothetical protein
MQQHRKRDQLLSRSERQSGDFERLTPASAQERPPCLAVLATQITRRVAAAPPRAAMNSRRRIHPSRKNALDYPSR